VLKLNDKIVITSALPYANGEIHLGHIVSTYLPADIFARFCRLNNKDVCFVCATDDFGTPILIKAEQENKKPEDYVKFWFEKDKKDFENIGIKFDFFGQTSSKENIQLVQHFFNELYKNGFIYEKEIEQLYCENCKKFLPDRYVKGRCPYCGAEDQYSDGCEKCGRVFETKEIIDPHCAICGSKPVLKKTNHYFFKLSEFSEQLKQWLQKNENLQKEVKNYVLNWIKDGLKDWDITRDISWGIPIPLKQAKGKVLYGWFDNHLCYITCVLKQKSKEFWNSSTIYHFIGKDIVYHHYLFLPAIRLGEKEYKLPDFIPVRGHLLLEGKKFSKSRDWYISINDFISSFPSDYLRYYLGAITQYSQKDTNFDWKEFQAKINNELVANIGNFIYRTLSFISSKFNGIVPEVKLFDESDKKFEQKIKSINKDVGELIEKLEFDRALKKILEFSDYCNQYFQNKEPWKTKDKTCLYLCVNAVKVLSVLLYPFLPDSCEKLFNQLNIINEKIGWNNIKEIKPGHKINKPEILFKKIEDHDIESKLKKLK